MKLSLRPRWTTGARRFAARPDLLARLPESALRRRALERALPLLKFKSNKLRRKTIEVTLPEACDKVRCSATASSRSPVFGRRRKGLVVAADARVDPAKGLGAGIGLADRRFDRGRETRRLKTCCSTGGRRRRGFAGIRNGPTRCSPRLLKRRRRYHYFRSCRKRGRKTSLSSC